MDVSGYYGITKYEPPIKPMGEQQERDHALFIKYTDICNLRHFPDVFKDGEIVSVSEKADGCNTRTAIVQGKLMIGSHQMRRKLPFGAKSKRMIQLRIQMLKLNQKITHQVNYMLQRVGLKPIKFKKPTNKVGTYYFAYTHEPVRRMLDELGKNHKQVILYSETFGPGIRSFQYGRKGLDYAAFDMMVDGKYLDVDDFQRTCDEFGVPRVPELARIPYSLDAVKTLASGKTVIGNGCHIREGVVVKPLHERVDPRVGRCILKMISDEYLLNLKEDFTDI
jgi:RNA ligase (TIGR02306 family)